MNKVVMIFIIGILSSTLLYAQEAKLYDVKSGKITYKVESSSSIMGTEQIRTSEKTVIFDNYGQRSITKENGTEKSTINGKKQTRKIKELIYMKDGVAYSVDYDQKSIYRMETMAGMMGGKVDGKAMMQQMGGKQVGTGKVLGYRCEIWEVMGSKIYLYKGVVLKQVSEIMGTKQTEIAKSAKFNIRVSERDFKLPDFPMQDEMGSGIGRDRALQMDAQNAMEMQEMQEAMQQLQSGDMLGMIKQQTLSQESILREVKRCLKTANSKNAVGRCMAKMPPSEDDEDEPMEFNAQTKQEMLNEIDGYLNNIVPCVKKAQTMDQLQQCMGSEE